MKPQSSLKTPKKRLSARYILILKVLYLEHVLQPGEETLLMKPKVKHPPKLHCWAGISWQGATPIIVWRGEDTMDSYLYLRILREGLIPWLQQKFPYG